MSKPKLSPLTIAEECLELNCYDDGATQFVHLIQADAGHCDHIAISIANLDAVANYLLQAKQAFEAANAEHTNDSVLC